jgi:hypothetical protein
VAQIASERLPIGFERARALLIFKVANEIQEVAPVVAQSVWRQVLLGDEVTNVRIEEWLDYAVGLRLGHG